MRISLSVATLVAILALMAAHPGVSYGQGSPAPAGTAVAVVDIPYIFENHAGFMNQMDGLKREMQQFQQEMQGLRTQMQGKQQDLQEAFEPGSPEHQALQREIAELASRVQVQTAMKTEEFRAREAKIYHDTYQQVVGVVATFAEHHGIQLVLKFRSKGPDVTDPQAVIQQVNQEVVYQARLNITYEILDILNQTAGVPAAGGTR